MNSMMTAMKAIPYTLTIDGREPLQLASIEFEPPPVDYVRSENATMPDPQWRFVDSHGHAHAWNITDEPGRRGKLSTVRWAARHVGCDGSCGGTCEGEGYTEYVARCAECGEDVNPGTVPDWEARTIGIPLTVGAATATATVNARVESSSERLSGVLTDGFRNETRRVQVGVGNWMATRLAGEEPVVITELHLLLDSSS